jgi:hypothetical protein
MAGETAREKDSARMDKFKVSTERGIDEEENVRPIRSPLKSKGSGEFLASITIDIAFLTKSP